MNFRKGRNIAWAVDVYKRQAENNIDALYCYGNEAKYLADEAKKAGIARCIHFQDKASLAELLRSEKMCIRDRAFPRYWRWIRKPS